MISQRDWDAALQSDHVQEIARKALDHLRSKGYQGNTAAYDWAIQVVIPGERLSYADHGAVVHFLGNQWILKIQDGIEGE